MLVEEPLVELFDKIGHQAEFDFGFLQCLPSVIMYAVQSYSSPYDLKTIDSSFLFRTSDITENEVVETNEFTITEGTKTYQYVISSPPVADLTGVSTVLATLKDIYDV